MENFQIIFTGVLVIATIVYVYYTYKLVQEARKTREIGMKPHIIMYLDYSEVNPSNRYLTIENVGKGVARNVQFRLIKDMEFVTKNDIKVADRKFLEKTYTYFPPEYCLKYYLFNFSNNSEEKMNDSIEVKCSYEDIFNQKTTEIFDLKFRNGFGAGKLSPPDNYIGLISYRLEKIEKILNKWITIKEQDLE